MTSQKTFKSRVRDRMDKTGESYTTARRQILAKADRSPATKAESPVNVDATQPAAVTEPVKSNKITEAAVRQRTGHGWGTWFRRLDEWGAADRRHADIARWLMTEHGLDNWSAQSITVSYEQERGVRAPGQGADGFYSATGTKTIGVPVERLYAAFADARLRKQWLPERIKVRSTTAPKTFRADWPDGSTRVAVGFTARGDNKAQVALAHERIADAATAAVHKAFWRERLSVLKTLLEA